MIKSKQKSRPNKSPALLCPNDDFSNKVSFYMAEDSD